MTRHACIYHSPLGAMALACDGDALTEVRFVADADAYGRCGKAVGVLVEAVRWLDAYFAGAIPAAMPPLAPQATPFRRRVWEAMLAIPYGHTVTYGELAQRVGCRSAQAVGQAVGHNPIAVIIPCHRVVGHGGRLTGYAYGTERKQWLLQHEHRGIS